MILLFGEQRFEFIAVAQRETNLQMQQLVAVGCAELALAFHCRRMISGQSPVVICVTDIGNENHAGDRCQAERAERVDAAEKVWMLPWSFFPRSKIVAVGGPRARLRVYTALIVAIARGRPLLRKLTLCTAPFSRLPLRSG